MPSISFATAVAGASLLLRLLGYGDVVDVASDAGRLGQGFGQAQPGVQARIQRFRLERNLNLRLNNLLASGEITDGQQAARAAVDLELKDVLGSRATLGLDDLALPLEELVKLVGDADVLMAKDRLGDPASQELFDILLRESLAWIQSEARSLLPFVARTAESAFRLSRQLEASLRVHESTIARQIDDLDARVQSIEDTSASGEAEAAERLLGLSDQYTYDLDLISLAENGLTEVRLSNGLYVERDLELVVERGLTSSIEPFEALIVGDAGHGKSSLLWAIHRRMRSGGDFEPVFISASWLLSAFGMDPTFDAETLDGALRYLASGPRRLVVLIDTADLLLHDENLRSTLLQVMVSARREGASMLATVRPLESQWLVSQGMRRYTLGPYEQQERAQAVNSLVAVFCPTGHPEAVAAIDAAEARGLPVAEVASNPLTLRLWFEGSAPHFPSVEADVTTIYRRYWAVKVADDVRITGGPSRASQDESLIAATTARVMMALGTPEPTEEAALTYVRAETVDSDLSLETLKSRGVLAVAGRNIRFFHQTLFEFAAARALFSDVSQTLATALLDRVLNRPDDLFLGSVLEQYIVIAADDQLRADWCAAAIRRLVESHHAPLQSIAVAAWAHHPGLRVSPDLLKSVSRWASSRFCKIAPSVTTLHTMRILELLRVLYDRREPRFDHDIIPALTRLLRRDPNLTSMELRRWPLFTDIFTSGRDDRRAREEALTLLSTLAHAAPDLAVQATRTVLVWANMYSKRRKITCALLEILAAEWDTVGSPAFLDEIAASVEVGQGDLDRDAAEVRRTLGALFARAWRSKLDEEPDRWYQFIDQHIGSAAEHPESPCAAAALIAIALLLAELNAGDPRISYTLHAFSQLPPPYAIWEPCRQALPLLAASQSAAAAELLSAIARDLEHLPAPPNVIEPPEVLRAAVARQVLLHPVVQPPSIATVASMLSRSQDESMWSDPQRLLALMPRAALGGVSAARQALPQTAGALEGWSATAIKLLQGAARDLALEDESILITLLSIAEYSAQTIAIRDLLRTKTGADALRPHLDRLLQFGWRLLRNKQEVFEQAGALLLESLAKASLPIPIKNLEGNVDGTRDPDARSALVRAAGLLALAEPQTWPHVEELCRSLVDLTTDGRIQGSARAFSQHREQVKVVEAARTAWLCLLSVKPYKQTDVDLARNLAFAPSRDDENALRRENIHLLAPIMKHWVRYGATGDSIDTLIITGHRSADAFSANPATQDKVANDMQPAIRAILAVATRNEIVRLLDFCKSVHPKWGVLLASSLGAIRTVDSRELLQSMLADEELHESIKRQISTSLAARTLALGSTPFPEMLATTSAVRAV